jgi:hypothetical protein
MAGRGARIVKRPTIRPNSGGVGHVKTHSLRFRPPEPAFTSQSRWRLPYSVVAIVSLSTLHAESVSPHRDGVLHQTSLRSQ